MKLTLVRFNSQADYTNGMLMMEHPQGRKMLCFTLEDEHRNKKVYGETRIPAGVYEIRFRKVGGFHGRYSRRFPEMHAGMLQLIDVPNFEYILIHIGNDDEDTAGCILTGNLCDISYGPDGFIGKSTDAYRKIYPIIAHALVRDERVFIRILDYA